MIAKSVSKDGKEEALRLGFAATLGWNEVKIIAASTHDLNMEHGAARASANEESALYHTEPVESSGFCIHLKLPRYVTFQSSLDQLRGIRRDSGAGKRTADDVMAGALARMAATQPAPEPALKEPAK